ncbi:phosphomevalonate kinase [Aphelenchoides avenae]|nr:phosphomevalonate kinase [Aphelenchus avenae]
MQEDHAATCTSVQPVVVCLSGKRKSGKDHVARILVDDLRACNIQAASVGISDPLKEEYAALHAGLDSEELKTDSAYKEKVRKEMVEFGERIRLRDPGYFCKKSIDRAPAGTQVIVVRDCRRPSDLDFFRRTFSNPLLVRVRCSDGVRKLRGYEFTPGIDDADTECALDEFLEWNAEVINEGSALDEDPSAKV